jgi:paraquat-inducible protein A
MPSVQRSACPECDLMIAIDPLERGQRARCPRCYHLLSAPDPGALTRGLAFALAAIVLLVMANAFPFLELRSNGVERVMTIPLAGLELMRDGQEILAMFVLGPIVIIPALMLVAMVALLVPLRQGIAVAWLIPTGRLLFALNPWSMVEVFIIGVIVSLVKIAAMATVITGISFWAYIGFAICFTGAVANLDRYQVWREIEACQP